MDADGFRTPTKIPESNTPKKSDYMSPKIPMTPPKTFITANGSPVTTPSKYRPDGGDRYIPLRESTEDWEVRYNARNRNCIFEAPESGYVFKRKKNMSVLQRAHVPYSAPFPPIFPDNYQNENKNECLVHKALLRNEMLKDEIDDIRSENESVEINKLYPIRYQPLFNYGPKSIYKKKNDEFTPKHVNDCTIPLSESSLRLLRSPRKPQRKVPKNPYKVLDAPELQDDFYLNLVDWSARNMLSVGLNSCVYLWSACNSQVIKLCDLASEADTVTSVQWTEKGDLLAVGTNKGTLQVWDVQANKKVNDVLGHSARIGCLAWNNDVICSGSRDRFIIQRDMRVPNGNERKLAAHRQEVCGLKWSPDKQYLASGGNDNQLLVWSLRKPDPVQVYNDHNAAVKALAWSPHHHGVLVSGGGTADRCLRFWNTLTGQAMHCIDTGSQVCNVAWSKHSSELVSTHGYSYNQVIIWKYPSLQPITKLTGHQYRVLYLAMSPDGESIVTGAGDETLRFWHVFSKSNQQKHVRSKLNIFTSIR
uniref:Fizzy-related protein homolog n=1 Tax=Strongyloides stercoralis TaxID=6248 RepID=A0A0K0E6E4_STRER